VAQWECVLAANVGVVLGTVSGLLGIDVDGLRGRKLRIEACEGDIPTTSAFSTSRGMRQLYASEPGVMVKTWAMRRDQSEVKLLGARWSTVMQSSEHASGRPYRWLRGDGMNEVKIAPAPRGPGY
jgi:hypothetical protein